jgi:hypothetical protein
MQSLEQMLIKPPGRPQPALKSKIVVWQFG